MKKLVGFLLILSLVMGCAHQGVNQQTGTGVGAVGGAVAGGLLGAATGGGPWRILTGAAIGAVAGGLVGSAIGKYMDDQEAALRNAMAGSISANQAHVQRMNEKTLVAVFKSDVFFDSGSAVVKPGGLMELDRVADVMKSYPNTHVRIEGHTDDVGSEDYNMDLSVRRAEAVRNILVKKGVSSERITTIGFGKSLPVSSDRAQNRRVNIILTSSM